MYESQISSHLLPLLRNGGAKRVIDDLINYCQNLPVEFEAIAVCGASGLLVGGAVAAALNKNIVLVRKKSEERHSSYDAEGVMCGDYIIIDDLVDTGRTLDYIQDMVNDLCEYSECVGVVLWNDIAAKNAETSYDGTWRNHGITFTDAKKIKERYISIC